jgi:hypothetical protein
MDSNPIKHSSERAGRVLSRKTANDLVGIVSVTYTSTAMESADERYVLVKRPVLKPNMRPSWSDN